MPWHTLCLLRKERLGAEWKPYSLVNKHSYWKWRFIVDLPIKKWWFSIVMLVLPEGNVRGAPTCSNNLWEGTRQPQCRESNPVRASGWDLFDHGDPWGPIRCAFVVGANPFDIDAVYICSTYSDIFGMTIWNSHNSQHLKRKFWHLWHMVPGSQLKHTKYRTPSRRPWSEEQKLTS